MPIRIGLIHALFGSIAPLESAFHEFWPEAEFIHLFDGSLYADYAAHGKVTNDINQRVAALIHHSHDAGAKGILFSGSLFGDAVETTRATMNIPVLTAYEGLIEAALSRGGKLTVLATVADSAHALAADLLAEASQQGLQVTVETQHVPGAMDALREGDSQQHDQLIASAASELVDCEALLLAQHSMAPACRLISDVPGRDVLNSPATAVAKLKASVGS